MTQQTINIGTVANDNTGDTLRTAFLKVNENFTEVYSNIATTIANTYGGTLTVTNLTDATDPNTGALQVKGGASVNKNLVVGKVAYIGQGASSVPLTNPTIVAMASGSNYIQGVLFNTNSNGSADWVVYQDNGNDVHGWNDMGITGSAFNDPNFTLTGPGEGYIFMSGNPDSISGGSLYFATDSTGLNNDIVFATGGFAAENEKMRYVNATGQMWIKSTTASTNTTTGALRVDGGVGVGQELYVAADLTVGGALVLNGEQFVANVSHQSYTVLDHDHNIFVNNNGISTVTITLQNQNIVPIGVTYTIKKVSSFGTVNIVPDGVTIDGLTSLSLTGLGSVTVILAPDGNYWITSKYQP